MRGRETLDTSCDTLVVLGPHTRDGHTLFAKNSDRPPDECQPLFRAPRLAHEATSRLRCQYVTIPQVAETLAVLGSRPWWLWGFEPGVNERRVVIGSEALQTREELDGTGLLGMDLVRLGLERGGTTAAAKQVITGLLERHGQGGNASQLWCSQGTPCTSVFLQVGLDAPLPPALAAGVASPIPSRPGGRRRRWATRSWRIPAA